MTKVFVSQYLEGPEPLASKCIAVGWEDRRELARAAWASLGPRVQWRMGRGWLVLEVIALTSIAMTVIAFLAFSHRAAWSLAFFDLVLVLILGTALAARAKTIRRCQRRLLNSPRNCALAFRLTNNELCAALRQSATDGIKDPPKDLTADGKYYRLEVIPRAALQPGDVILVEAGQSIFTNGIILRGAAMIDESVVTGCSTFVLREAGGDCEVMHDTLVVAGRILVEVMPPLGHPLDWIPGTVAGTRSSEPAL
jgi:high-affinity K+ transport system ATPase subunit B